MFCSAVDLVLEPEPAGGLERPDEVRANVTQLFASIQELAAEQPLVVFIKVRTALRSDRRADQAISVIDRRVDQIDG